MCLEWPPEMLSCDRELLYHFSSVAVHGIIQLLRSPSVIVWDEHEVSFWSDLISVAVGSLLPLMDKS